jgi:mRNA interferase RelE/StbE
MAYTPLYHPAVLKEDLPKLSPDVKERIKTSIENKLLADPIAAGSMLRHSLKGHRKFRVGDWRVIYRIDRDYIFILKIGHRREAYECTSKRTQK